MVIPPKDLRKFSSLVDVVTALRGPDGCPWDKEQTQASLTQYIIEEAHELAEAIENGDQAEVCEELGDLLLQVVLQAEVARQESQFELADVIEAINTKMVRRHPHVFSTTQVEDSGEVLKNWDEIKKTEYRLKKKPEDFGVPVSLPALQRAQKIGSKTTRRNFDWSTALEVLDKVKEEIGELEEAIKNKNKNEQNHEIGDLLFSIVQLARHLQLDAEQSLRQTNSRFEKRFFAMKKLAADAGQNFDDLSQSELEQLWQQVKKTSDLG